MFSIISTNRICGKAKPSVLLPDQAAGISAAGTADLKFNPSNDCKIALG